MKMSLQNQIINFQVEFGETIEQHVDLFVNSNVLLDDDRNVFLPRWAQFQAAKQRINQAYLVYGLYCISLLGALSTARYGPSLYTITTSLVPATCGVGLQMMKIHKHNRYKNNAKSLMTNLKKLIEINFAANDLITRNRAHRNIFVNYVLCSYKDLLEISEVLFAGIKRTSELVVLQNTGQQAITYDSNAFKNVNMENVETLLNNHLELMKITSALISSFLVTLGLSFSTNLWTSINGDLGTIFESIIPEVLAVVSPIVAELEKQLDNLRLMLFHAENNNDTGTNLNDEPLHLQTERSLIAQTFEVFHIDREDVLVKPIHLSVSTFHNDYIPPEVKVAVPLEEIPQIEPPQQEEPLLQLRKDINELQSTLRTIYEAEVEAKNSPERIWAISERPATTPMESPSVLELHETLKRAKSFQERKTIIPERILPDLTPRQQAILNFQSNDGTRPLPAEVKPSEHTMPTTFVNRHLYKVDELQSTREPSTEEHCYYAGTLSIPNAEYKDEYRIPSFEELILSRGRKTQRAMPSQPALTRANYCGVTIKNRPRTSSSVSTSTSYTSDFASSVETSDFASALMVSEVKSSHLISSSTSTMPISESSSNFVMSDFSDSSPESSDPAIFDPTVPQLKYPEEYASSECNSYERADTESFQSTIDTDTSLPIAEPRKVFKPTATPRSWWEPFQMGQHSLDSPGRNYANIPQTTLPLTRSGRSSLPIRTGPLRRSTPLSHTMPLFYSPPQPCRLSRQQQFVRSVSVITRYMESRRRRYNAETSCTDSEMDIDES